MPKYTRSGWADAGQTATELSGSLQGLALELGRAKYQRQYQHDVLLQHALQNAQLNKFRDEQLRLQEQHQAAQIAQAVSMSHYNEARTGNLQDQAGQGQALGAIMQYMQNNPGSEQDLMGDVTGLGSSLAAQHPATIAKSISQMMALNNPEERRALAAGGEKNLWNNVPAGATAFSSIPGVLPNQGGVTVAPGGAHTGAQIGLGGNRAPDFYGIPQQATGDTAEGREYGRNVALLGQLMRDPTRDPGKPGPLLTSTIEAIARSQSRPRGGPAMPSVIPQTSAPIQIDPSTAFPVPQLGSPMDNYGVPRSEPGDTIPASMPEFDPSAAFQVPQFDPSAAFAVPQYGGRGARSNVLAPPPQATFDPSMLAPPGAAQGTEPAMDYLSNDNAPKTSAAAIKAARANDLEKQYPTLSRQQIIDMVNQEFNQR